MAMGQQGQVGSRAVGRNSVNCGPEEKHQMIAYSLCLNKADVVVLGIHQVILVESRMLRWCLSSIPHLEDRET